MASADGVTSREPNL